MPDSTPVKNGLVPAGAQMMSAWLVNDHIYIYIYIYLILTFVLLVIVLFLEKQL